MIIASLYPCPFDSQERHESNSTIIYKNQIFSSEEAKLTTVKQDATSRFPERSLLLGCKHFNIQPKDIDHWVFPKTKLKISDTYLISFFSYAITKARGKDAATQLPVSLTISITLSLSNPPNFQ